MAIAIRCGYESLASLPNGAAPVVPLSMLISQWFRSSWSGSNEALFTGCEANPMNQAIGKKVALLLHFLRQRSNGAHQAVSFGFEQQAACAQHLEIIDHAGHTPRFLLILIAHAIVVADPSASSRLCVSTYRRLKPILNLQ